MNTITLFDLPSDMSSRIYAFDSTFKSVFATEDARLDIRHMSQKIKQTPEYIKDFIQSELLHHLPDYELKIFLHPKEYLYTKFQIVNKSVEPSAINIDDFDGYICNEQQNAYFMYFLDINQGSYSYKENETWMTMRGSNLETGLYLHTANYDMNQFHEHN